MTRARLALLGLTLAGCDAAPRDAAPSAGHSSVAQASASASAGVAPPARPEASSPAASPSASLTASAASGCPSDMVLASGAFCPDVEQRCLRHTREWDEAQKQPPTDGKSHVSERCLEYAPSVCRSSARRPMRYCIDRHEWPNRAGDKPAFMVTWGWARDACAKVGKRLCTADELTFACEGDAMLPYAYGLARDAARCNIDKPYVQPRFRLQPYEDCLRIPSCKAHMEELDQREPIGARPGCGSPFGAFDLNGNVNEWVEIPGQTAPWRSGLKGGWWGPSRARCRPIVTSHNENYVGYEVGFRCCRDADP